MPVSSLFIWYYITMDHYCDDFEMLNFNSYLNYLGDSYLESFVCSSIFKLLIEQ